jgi:hypothetical protein
VEGRGGRRKNFIRVLPCHGCLHVQPHHVEGDTLLQIPPQKAANDHWKKSHTPSKGRLLCTYQPLFFNYRKTRIPLTPQDYYKKTKVKKPIEPLDLRQKKKDDLMGCVTIILYKKCENALQTLVVFFF